MDPKAQAEGRVGTTVGKKWKLEKLLGIGGMAAVYVAVHKIGRREAIKILHPDIARAPDIRARFEQEAHVVHHFHHPGAVDIRDIDVTDDGAPFLVMELLTGETLADRSARLGGIELPELLRFVDELLDVMSAAHAEGIVHRDIKLDNLFIRQDGRLKILDFGIAHVRAGLSADLKTRMGATLGTTTYMPPEQILGHDVDGRADIFAIGATMFRIIAKRKIHEADTETEMVLKMATQPAPPLLAVAPSVPQEVCMVVDRALMFDRARRYPDAATMQGDIRALREGKPPPYAAARMQEADSPRSMVTVVASPTGPSTSPEAPTRTGLPQAIVPPAPLSGTEPTLAASMAEPTLAAPMPDAAPAAIVAPAPASTTTATGLRADIAGGIGTELNLPTRTKGGTPAIGILDRSAPKRTGIPLGIFLGGGLFLLLIIGGVLFWALDDSSSETQPAPSSTAVQGGRGRGPRPAGAKGAPSSTGK